MTVFFGAQDQKTVIFARLFNHEMLITARVYALVFLVGGIVIARTDPYIGRDMWQAWRTVGRSIRQELFNLKGRRLFLFLWGVGMVGLLLWCYNLPFQLDELHTWMFFVERGPLVVASYYPGSNNHILYNLLSWLWNVGLPPLWSIRVVSLLSGIFCWMLFALILHRQYGFRLSLIGTFLLMTASPFVWYSAQGRGYVLELFWLMMLWYALVFIKEVRVQERIFVCCNVLAVYTLPVALLPLSVLNGTLLWRMWSEDIVPYRSVLRLIGYTVAGIVMVYAPVFIFSGWQALFNNPFVHTLGDDVFADSLNYAGDIGLFLSGNNGYWASMLGVCCVLGAIMMAWRKSYEGLLGMAVLSLPLLLLTVYPVLLFERTWLWLLLPLVFLFLQFFRVVDTGQQKWPLVFTGCLLTVWLSFHLRNLTITFQTVKAYEREMLLVCHQVEKQLKGKVLRVEDDAAYNHLRYYWLQDPDYQLVYGPEQGHRKADAVLDLLPGEGFKEGKAIMWQNKHYVLYRAR